MAKVKTARAYDPAEFLDSPEVISEYLTEAFKTDDEVLIARAIGAVARAHRRDAGHQDERESERKGDPHRSSDRR